jgi:DMSO/TMAO reductase YedYZ molybdopterin-dependent catalytic subunit
MPKQQEPGTGYFSRRGFLQVASAVAAGWPFERWFEQWRALGMRPEPKRVTPYITPSKDFYLVAVDPSFRPALDAGTVASHWSLQLTGAAGKARAFLYPELLARATHTIDYTFECIGNEVGGQLIGNARWHVIPLRELLAQAPGGTAGTGSVLFTGLDDFYSSVSSERALDDDAFLALRMNGEPLPAAHGFPARVILPDLYGMKQPRWLKAIELQATRDTTSFWEKRGWAGEVPVKTMSRLDPRDTVAAGKRAPITGIAFAGRRGIRTVEVSLDGGARWVPCELVTPTRPGVWSLWRYEWNEPTEGHTTLEVRATDGNGRIQTAQREDPSPDGASGYDRESVRVETA